MPRKTMASAICNSWHLTRMASWRGLPCQRSSSPKWMRSMRAGNSCFMTRLSSGIGIGRWNFLAGVEGAIGVLDDVNVREDHQALLHHLVNEGKERAQLLRGVDGRKHHGAVVGGEQRLVFMDATVGAVAEDAAVDRHSGNIVGAHGFDERLVERLVLPAVFFAEEDAHHLRFSFQLQMAG